jgi:hypothetical protein
MPRCAVEEEDDGNVDRHEVDAADPPFVVGQVNLPAHRREAIPLEPTDEVHLEPAARARLIPPPGDELIDEARSTAAAPANLEEHVRELADVQQPARPGGVEDALDPLGVSGRGQIKHRARGRGRRHAPQQHEVVLK